MKIKIKNKGNGWVGGKCEDYDFEAKVYDDGSKFGINNGRVSKLSIWNEKDRIMEVLENYKRVEW